MEVRKDAIECRDRCLAAVVTAENIEDGQACWLMAVRYNQRVRMSDPDHARLESQSAAGVSRVQGE